MIPYVEFYTWRVGPVPVGPFGPCVAIAVYVNWELAKKRARFYGWDVKKLASLSTWMVCWGFVLGHMFDEITYYPREAITEPWKLFTFWEHMSSYGGFIGAVGMGFWWKYFETVPWKKLGPITLYRQARRKVPEGPGLLVSDIFTSSLLVGWCVGRLGCALVHDHPGREAARDSLFAVAYGPGPVDDYGIIGLHHGMVPRYDLGLLELLLCIPVTIAFIATWKKRFPPGTYTVALCLIYSVLRFPLDFLRVAESDGGDARYLSLTPAQWVCVACFAFALWLWKYSRARAAEQKPRTNERAESKESAPPAPPEASASS
jgi:phosphatidylglycerol:prolipoprotein diacylglycerol transferase